MFPKNAWYVACMPDEIDSKPLGRKICGEAMVLYRGPQNKATALEDFCPHRGAPLSLGSVQEGKLVCGYHGLEMGCDGKTVAMPGQRVQAVCVDQVDGRSSATGLAGSQPDQGLQSGWRIGIKPFRQAQQCQSLALVCLGGARGRRKRCQGRLPTRRASRHARTSASR